MPSVKVSIAPSLYSIIISVTSARSATVTNNSDMQVYVQLEFADKSSIVKKKFSGTYINPGRSATVEPNSDGTITGLYVMYPAMGAAVNYVPVSSTGSGTAKYYITPPPMAG